MKTCKICGVEKDVGEFYLNKKRGTYDAYCKDCFKIRVKERIAANPQKHREYVKTWYTRNVERMKENVREYDAANPEKGLANASVRRALDRGASPPQSYTCVSCSATAEIYHHWSYLREHFLSVIPMCQKCHSRHHHHSLGIDILPSMAILLEVQKHVTN